MDKDKYKCLKLKLDKFLDSTKMYNKKHVKYTIDDAIKRTNKIVSKAYLLLRLWVLNKYEHKNIIRHV